MNPELKELECYSEDEFEKFGYDDSNIDVDRALLTLEKLSKEGKLTPIFPKEIKIRQEKNRKK